MRPIAFTTLALLSGGLTWGQVRFAASAPASAGAPERGLKRSAIVRIEPGTFSPAAAKRMASRKPGEPLHISIFPEADMTVEWERAERAGQGSVWYGAIRGAAMGSAVVVASDNGMVAGNFDRGDGLMLQLRTHDDGPTYLRTVDQKEFPDERPPLRDDVSREWDVKPVPEAAIRQAGSPSADDDGSTIDVMVVYTPEARLKAGGPAAMGQLIQLAIAETNQGYANSGVIHRLRLVYAAEVNHRESSNLGDDLERITNPSDGYLDDVLRLRDSYAADIVSLWVEGGDACGIAWLASNTSGNAARGFSVVARECATGYYSFGHEIGHNLGATHSRDDNTGPGLFPYSYAFKNLTGNKFRTIMGYNNNCDCPRVNYWSNPGVRVNGVLVGADQNAAQPTMNFLTLNNARTFVASYRQSQGGGSTPPPAGSGAFPESPHPYVNDFDQTYTYSIAGATSLSITFDSRTSAEPGYDFIHVLNGQGQPIAGSPFTGADLAGKTVSVTGSSVRIRLTSDENTVDYGFRVTSITAGGSSGGTALPRLEVTSVTAPATGQIGGQIAVRAEYRNSGTAPAGAFRLGLYFSADRTITTSDILAATCDSAGLEAGASSFCAGNTTVPSRLTPGAWFFGALADDQNQVSQSSRQGNAAVAANSVQIGGGSAAEITSPAPGSVLNGTTITFQWSAGNNVSGFILQVGRSANGSEFFDRDMGTARIATVVGLPADGGAVYVRLTSKVPPQNLVQSYQYAAVRGGAGGSAPKLVVRSFTAPRTGSVGVNLTEVKTVLANEGNAPAGPFRVGFYYGRGDTVGASDTSSGWYCNFPEGLPAGSASTCNGEVGVPRALPAGSWNLAAIADDQNRVAQSDRGGNSKLNDNGRIEIGGVAAAELLSPANGATFTSSTVTFRWNSGSGGLQYALRAGSAAGESDFADIDAGTALSANVTGLPTNGRQIFVRLYTKIGEDWYFQDATYRAANLAVVRPRLVVTSFSTATSGTIGGDVGSATLTVQNQGNGNAGAYRIGFYWGRSATITTSGVFSGTTCTVGNGTPASSTFTCTGQIGIPPSLTPGQWFLAAIADDTSVVEQSSRAGNTRVSDAGPIQLAAASAGGGGSGGLLPESDHPYPDFLDRTYTYNAPGNPSAISVKFDPRTSFEDGWDYLHISDGAGRAIAGSPFTGAQLAGRTVVVSGASVRLRLVSDDSVGDWGFLVTSITPVSGGDLPRLVLTSLLAPTSATAGGELPGTSAKVQNTGTGRAGAFRIGYYWNRSATGPASQDVDSGWSCTFADGLAPGASTSCTGNIGVPAQLAAGTWFLIAVADDQNQLAIADRSVARRANDNGATTVSNSATVALPESPHPYADLTDRTWTYTQPGNPSAIRIAFSAETSFEDDFDFLYVADAQGRQIAGSPFTGRRLAGVTITVPGSTVRLRLVADDSVNDYGFRVTSITAGSADLRPGVNAPQDAGIDWTSQGLMRRERARKPKPLRINSPVEDLSRARPAPAPPI